MDGLFSMFYKKSSLGTSLLIPFYEQVHYYTDKLHTHMSIFIFNYYYAFTSEKMENIHNNTRHHVHKITITSAPNYIPYNGASVVDGGCSYSCLLCHHTTTTWVPWSSQRKSKHKQSIHYTHIFKLSPVVVPLMPPSCDTFFYFTFSHPPSLPFILVVRG